MVFVSNYQILVRFKYGKSVVFMSNGSVVHYPKPNIHQNLLDSSVFASIAG